MGSLDNVMDEVRTEVGTVAMRAPFDVVLSGPITGTADHKERFERAGMIAAGWFCLTRGRAPNVWNPARLPDGHTNEWYMRRCHDAIFDSPGCVLVQLERWEESRGSRSEHALCVSLGREVVGMGEIGGRVRSE